MSKAVVLTELDTTNDLTEYLRAPLRKSDLRYHEPPAPVTGGFDALIYGPLRGHGATSIGGYGSSCAASCASTQPGRLGPSFLIMERVPGRPMEEDFFRPSARFFRLPGILAKVPADR